MGLHNVLPVADGSTGQLCPISQSHQSSNRPQASQPILLPSAGRLEKGQLACMLVYRVFRSLCVLIAVLLLSHIQDVAWQ
jgi:hypothetical protein